MIMTQEREEGPLRHPGRGRHLPDHILQLHRLPERVSERFSASGRAREPAIRGVIGSILLHIEVDNDYGLLRGCTCDFIIMDYYKG